MRLELEGEKCVYIRNTVITEGLKVLKHKSVQCMLLKIMKSWCMNAHTEKKLQERDSGL